MNIFLYMMTVLVWGSTWIAMTYQLGTVPLDNSIFYRIAFASFLLFIWCLIKRYKLLFSSKDHVFFITQGFFLFSINYLAAYAALHYIPSGLNAIGFSSVLIFNIINSAIFYRTPITLPTIVGAMSGMGGILMIFWPAIATLDFSNGSFLGVFLSLLAGLLASFGNIVSVRNQKKNISVLVGNAYGMAYGGLWMLGVMWLKGIPFQFDYSYTYIFSLLYLSVLGTVVAFGCYLTLLGRIGASKAAYSLVMTPVVALGISSILEGFVWESHIFMGLGFIFLGNMIILARKPAKKRKTQKSATLSLLKEAA